MRIASSLLSILAVFLAFPALAGTIEGAVHVSTPPAAVARAGNPYPGRAGSLPDVPSVHRGRIEDAVIYIDRYPAAAESTFARYRKAMPSLAQRDQAFVPRVLAVPIGAKVDFPNMDRIYHNVFSLSPVKRFDLGKYPRGSSRQVVFTKVGLVNVYCDIHSDMEAFILVLPHAGFARPQADGDFSFVGLPAGKYRVKVWHPDFAEQAREIEVPAKGTATCDFTF